MRRHILERRYGAVGIGTTNPQASLNINNGSSAAMVRLDSNGHIGYVFQNTNATIVVQEDSGGVYMSSGGTSWVSNSDRRLKTNISPQGTGELSRIMSLNPVTFHWKDAGQDATQGPQYGFIAQDVQKVYPEFVTLGGETKIAHKDGSSETVKNTLGISHTSLISPLVKAVQEIYHMVIGYKADIMVQMKVKAYIPHMKIPLFPIYRGEPSSKIPFPYATKVMAQIKWMSILQTSLQLR